MSIFKRRNVTALLPMPSNNPHLFIVRRHQLVPLHTLRELPLTKMRRMRPRLQPILPPYRLRKTRAPPFPRPLCHNALDSLDVHQLRVPAHVVEYRSELDQRPDPRQRAGGSEILVPDHRLCHVLGLLDGRREGFEQREGEHAAVEFEGHQRCRDVLVCGPDVVEQAAEEVRLVEGRGFPGWKCVREDCLPCSLVSLFFPYAARRPLGISLASLPNAQCLFPISHI